MDAIISYFLFDAQASSLKGPENRKASFMGRHLVA
jgi:hypothetical protein